MILVEDDREALSILSLFMSSQFSIFWCDQVAFDKVGIMSLQSISKQRKKEQPAVMAELERRGQRLNPSDSVQSSSR